MTDNEFKYWAFLSYSQQDNRQQRTEAQAANNLCWGDWLHDALKIFSIPAEFIGQINGRGEIIPDRIGPIFQDESEQPENANLSADIRQALEQSRCLIVICSPHSAQSLHVNEAVRYFKQLGRSKQILPIVIAGEPNAGAGNNPGISAAAECFVPALRHPVQPEGTLDTTRQAGRYLFVDARHGADKREILAADHRNAEADLETAKIQLIAGVIGVAFHGLWWREQKRHFIALAETQRQLQDAQRQIREAQNQVLEIQNLPRDIHSQIQEAQIKATEAQNQAHEARKQLQEFQNKALDTQGQLEEARSRVLAAENKVQEAQTQARKAQQQFEEARNQIRESQSKVLETQNLPSDVHSQIQEAQNQARNAQSQIELAQNQAREAQDKLLSAENQVRDAQSRVIEIENKTRETQNQLDEARRQLQLTESKVLEGQNQIEEARNQARVAQNKVQEIQNQTRDVQSQIQAAQDKVSAAQNQAREIQTQSQSARRLTKIFAIMAVLALLAAGIALRKGKVASQTLEKNTAREARQSDSIASPTNQEQIRQALQKVAGAGQDQLRNLDKLAAQILVEEIPGALKTSSALSDDRQRTYFQKQLLTRLSALNPQSAMTNASAIAGKIVDEAGANDSNFYLQLAVLDSWTKTNLTGAFSWVGQLTNVDSRQRALEQIVPSLAADNPTNTLAQLNELKPAPSGQIYTLFFQHWATNDPVAAIQQRQQIPDRDADGKIFNTIMAAWVAKDSASAAEYVKNLPPGDYRQKAIAELCQHWADTGIDTSTTNTPAILTWAQSLPTEAEQLAAMNQIVANWARKDPQAAMQFANQHPELSGDALGKIAEALAKTDLAIATNWVVSLPDGQKKNTTLLAMSETWAQTDPKGMAVFALGLPAGEIQTQYLTHACCQLAARDLPGTVELLQPLSDAALRQNLLESVGRSCDLSHTEQAAKYIAAMPAGNDQRAAITGLLASWSPVDPEASVNWLSAFPETNAQPEQVASVIQVWAQREPAAAAKWLTNAPAEIDGERTINAFLEGVVAKYPEYAAQWTQSVTDAAKRQKYQIQVARPWLKTDSSAASKWIDSLDLPDEIKQSLKAPLP